MIERHSFEDTADLDALFLIATRFDDGHHLTAIQFEGCWYCSKPRLFEFGGNGCYLSREVRVISSSSQASSSATTSKAIVAADIEEASALDRAGDHQSAGGRQRRAIPHEFAPTRRRAIGPNANDQRHLTLFPFFPPTGVNFGGGDWLHHYSVGEIPCPRIPIPFYAATGI